MKLFRSVSVVCWLQNNFSTADNQLCVFSDFPFSGTKFCESLLLPTEYALRKSLDATFINANKEIHLDEKYYVDSCCHSLHKCDAYKRIALNQTNDTLWNFQHCDCVYFFKICLYNLNTSLSNEVALLHSINTTKCYTNDHPIIQCIKFESYTEWKIQFFRYVNQTERKRLFNRCSKYQLDKNKPHQLQLRDLPFNYHEMMFANDTKNISQDISIPYQG